MCCLCSERVTVDSAYQEISRYSRIFIGADIAPSINLAIAMRVIVLMAQSRDAYHQISELKAGPAMVSALVSDFIDESADYARTFGVSKDAIDMATARHMYVVLGSALQACDVDVTNPLSVAWLAMADSIFSAVTDDGELKELVETHVMLFNAERDAFANPDALAN